jgi:hypothetical protein
LRYKFQKVHYQIHAIFTGSEEASDIKTIINLQTAEKPAIIATSDKNSSAFGLLPKKLVLI